jgi:TPR repeat protein
MGVSQDDTKALYWYRLAAKQGDERAQKKVMIMENELQNSGTGK